MSDPQTRAAKSVLGVPADADIPALRAAFLRQLRDGGFTPTPIVVEAIATLGLVPRVSVQPRVHLVRRMEENLANAIAVFAKHYWELTPDERQEAWRSLADQAQPWPRQVARLDMLRDGLSLTPPSVREPLQASLVATIQELYPKPALEQTALWFDFLSKHSDEDKLAATVRVLQRTHPAFVKLVERRLPLDLRKHAVPRWQRPFVKLRRMERRDIAVLLFVVAVIAGTAALFVHLAIKDGIHRQPAAPTFGPTARTDQERAALRGMNELANNPQMPKGMRPVVLGVQRKLLNRLPLDEAEQEFVDVAAANNFLLNRAVIDAASQAAGRLFPEQLGFDEDL